MDNVDGFAGVEAMQQQPDLRDMPVIVVTSKDLSSAEKNWLRARTMSVANKGADSRTQLVDALRELIPPAAG
jgi:CheY-like chemotaxis protein